MLIFPIIALLIISSVGVECGNGVFNFLVGEACDDGNIVNGDGCSIGC